MEWYEAAFDRTYPILYPHRSADEAFAAIATFAPYLADATPVLDLASGGGRYLEGLHRRGFEAFGLDLSLYLLERSLDRWAWERKGPTRFKIGRLTYYDRNDINAWLEMLKAETGRGGDS